MSCQNAAEHENLGSPLRLAFKKARPVLMELLQECFDAAATAEEQL